MSLDSKITKFVMITVLIFHTLWILNHLRWVAYGQINPWKLGGYGMYTMPDPNVTLTLFDMQFPGAPFKLDPSDYSLASYRKVSRFTNIRRVFRCAHIKPKQLKAFFEENPQLRGRNLGFLYAEGKFIQNPVSVKRVEQGHVTVIWTGKDDFEFTSEFCGSREIGKVSFS